LPPEPPAEAGIPEEEAAPVEGAEEEGGEEKPEEDPADKAEGGDDSGDSVTISFIIHGLVSTEIDPEKVSSVVRSTLVEKGIKKEDIKGVSFQAVAMRFLRKGFFDAIKKGAGAAVEKVKDFMGMGEKKDEETPEPAEIAEAMEETGANPEEIAEALEETGSSPKEAEEALEDAGVKEGAAEEAVESAEDDGAPSL